MSGVEIVEIKAEEADQRLDRWLRRRFPGLTQGRIEKLLRKGEIRMDGKRADGKTRVYAGQMIRLPPNIEKAVVEMAGPAPVSDSEAREIRRMVIHEDADIIVLNKPAGLAVQGGTGQGRHVDGMLGAFVGPDGERPRLVHRLDLETSGVLVLGRTLRATVFLAEAFRGRSVRKTYWALVAGVPKPPRGRIDMALAKSGGPAGERIVRDDEEGKRAVTLYATIDQAIGRCAWLALRPVTGRTHQLRVHTAVALGTPIVGDAKYGGTAATLATDALSPLLHLHARALSLPHPAGGMLRVTAPLPPHMKQAWQFFGFDLETDTEAVFERRAGDA